MAERPMVTDLNGPGDDGWWVVTFEEPPLPGLLERYADPGMRIEYRVQVRQVAL